MSALNHEGNPGLQVGKESGICSLSRNRSDDRLTSKAHGGEGRGCGFSTACLAVWELQSAAEVGQGEVGSRVETSARTTEMEQMSQRRGNSSNGDKTCLKSPSPLCICRTNVAVAHVCARRKKGFAAKHIWEQVLPLQAKPGLWDLEHIFPPLNLHFLILKNGISDSYLTGLLWISKECFVSNKTAIY